MIEEWRDIKGYEGFYQASNLGRVRSLDRIVVYKNGRTHLQKGRILCFGVQDKGYNNIQLYKNGVGKTKLVHRLVWETFNGEIPKGMQVNHINEVKTDNRLCNLNLLSCRDNNMWGTATKRRIEKKNKRTVQFSLDGEYIKEWKSVADIVKECNYGQSNISACCLGRKKSAYGYIWKYKN